MDHDDNHLTASRKDMWSNLCLLVDAAVMLSEEEHHKRIFYRFPRKTRSSSLAKRRYPQQILNASSMLIDLDHIPTDSEPQDHFQRLSSPSFIAADSESKTPQNPSYESCFSLLLFDYKTAESKKMVTQYPLISPNFACSLSLCLPGNKSSKKRLPVQERKRTGGAKKARVAPLSGTARETPEWLAKVMIGMNGAKDAKLIFEKTLFVTDVNPTQNRLSMPFNNLLRNDFLTSVESKIIDKDVNNNKKIGVGAILVDQRCEKWGVMLKRWEMKKSSGKGSWNYNLICGWNDVVKANRLKDGDNISLWSFRCCGILCFAMEQSSSSLALCLY